MAIRCLSGNRASNRYTRTFVSTSAATPVEILAAPPAIRPPATTLLAPLPLALPLRCLIEECQTPRSAVLRAGQPPWSRYDANHIASWNPVDVVTGTDTVPLGNRFRDGDLEFAGDPRHRHPCCSKDMVLVKWSVP